MNNKMNAARHTIESNLTAAMEAAVQERMLHLHQLTDIYKSALTEGASKVALIQLEDVLADRYEENNHKTRIDALNLGRNDVKILSSGIAYAAQRSNDLTSHIYKNVARDRVVHGLELDNVRKMLEHEAPSSAATELAGGAVSSHTDSRHERTYLDAKRWVEGEAQLQRDMGRDNIQSSLHHVPQHK